MCTSALLQLLIRLQQAGVAGALAVFGAGLAQRPAVVGDHCGFAFTGLVRAR